MTVLELLEILVELPDDTQVTVQTSHYDGGQDVYTDMNPTLIVKGDTVVIVGREDYYGKLDVCKWLSDLPLDAIRKRLRHCRDKVINLERKN